MKLTVDPKEMITCTDSSSDDESVVSTLSIENNQAGTQIIPLAINAWNGGYSESINRVFQWQDEEYDQSLSSYVVSVSPSDEEAYQQEINGDVTDRSSEHSGISKRPKLDVEIDSNDSGRLPLANSEKDKAADSTRDEVSASEELLQSLNPELISRIEEQKEKSIKEFLDWKIELPKYFSNHPGLLSVVFSLNLNTLVEGEYWFGSDFMIGRNQPQAPHNSPFVGLIQSEGLSGKKYLFITGKQKVELNVGYSDAVTDLLTIKVDEEGVLSLSNKAKPSFLKVCAGPPDLFYDYNPKMVFVGIITSDKTFKVKILGHDVEFNLDVFGNECQIIYIDHLSKLQKIYPVRAVVLNVISKYVAIVDFNYSYAGKSKGKYQPKFIDLLIPAGANPYYF